MRNKLIKLLENLEQEKELFPDERAADYLIAHGVTIQRWIPVDERLPTPFISVLVQMPDEEPCPTVREGFVTNEGIWYTGFFSRLKDEVTHWMPMPSTEGLDDT